MSSNDDGSEAPKPDTEFKKPVLIGRMGKLPKKVKPESEKPVESSSPDTPENKVIVANAFPNAMTDIPITYKEPKWSGLCPEGSEYALEVLKSGMIVDKLDLTKKPFYLFGRFTNCDVIMTHPTISRHHAILQYKAFSEDGEPTSGWYLYDLGSTHGTFLNKEKVKRHHYVRVKVGHQIKFGTSARTFIVLGPDFDIEGEADLSVTEIRKRAQNMKIEKDRMIQQTIEQRERDRVEEEKRREEQGIDWGMGEDAEDETDLTDNPYASTANEELYLEDPKKTLRGYFEREGCELTYDCEERGVGQYICRVELPMDDMRGKPVVAEVIHRGKKKEAVVACALEACRILDRAGLLRQARHESRRRRDRDWGADDYYDSDEDTYLDRTGSVEKKRQARMEKHGVVQTEADKPMTYDDLVKLVSELKIKIEFEEKTLEQLRSTQKPIKEENMEVDDLDDYMVSLGKQGQSMAEKAEISKTKMCIQKLKTELSKTQRLAELARPANLPPIIKKDTEMAVKQMNSVVYGKRIRLKEDLEKKQKEIKEGKQEEEEFMEEMDSDEEAGPSKDEKVQEEESKDITESDVKVQEEESKDITESDVKVQEEESKDITESGEKVQEKEFEDITELVPENVNKDEKDKKIYGPMQPPENYVVPEGYFEQETDRDLPEIEEKE